MKFFSKFKYAFLTSSIAISCFNVSTANAHEARTIGNGALHAYVGWRNEPAYEKVVNAFDFIIADDINIRTFNLSVDVLFLQSDSPTAAVLNREKLKGKIIRDEEFPNRFNIWLLPAMKGAYGFQIKGTIEGIAINETFICGGGTKNPAESFSCIQQAQSFPSNATIHQYGW